MAPTITTTLPALIPVGIAQGFQVCTIADGDLGTIVRIPIFVNPSQIPDFTLYYIPPGGTPEQVIFDPATGEALFGPGTGFPLADACSNFDIVVNTPGAYTFVIEIVRVSDGAILTSFTDTFEANNITGVVRMFSSGGATGLTYVSPASRADAIAGAIGSTPNTAVKATVLTGTDTDLAMRTWDRIAPYTNAREFEGATQPPNLTAPQFIWDSVTTDGEVRYFAMAAPFSPVLLYSGLLLAAYNFADNAHDFQASIYNAATKALVAQGPILQDGNITTPAIGLTEVPPFNWQTVRSNTQFIASTLAPENTYYVVVSYTVLNYLQIAGRENPATLSFIVDVGGVV